MKAKYSKEQLDTAYQSLNETQRQVLDQNVKRGMQTKWLNILAKQKGSVLTESGLDNIEETMKKLLDWVLIDYVDGGEVTPTLKCLCGRSLRYRYTVMNMNTGEVIDFGKEHFKQHVGLDPKTVAMVKKGMDEIDLERDEILTKIIDGWKLNFDIQGIEIPKDMVAQLNIGLPLLFRQENRLFLLTQEKQREKFTQKQEKNKRFTSSRYQKPASPKVEEAKTKFAIPVEKEFELGEVTDETIGLLTDKLAKATIQENEARRLYEILKRQQQGLGNYRIEMSLDEYKKTCNYALGRIGNKKIRYWLVEIEYL